MDDEVAEEDAVRAVPVAVDQHRAADQVLDGLAPAAAAQRRLQVRDVAPEEDLDGRRALQRCRGFLGRAGPARGLAWARGVVLDEEVDPPAPRVLLALGEVAGRRCGGCCRCRHLRVVGVVVLAVLVGEHDGPLVHGGRDGVGHDGEPVEQVDRGAVLGIQRAAPSRAGAARSRKHST